MKIIAGTLSGVLVGLIIMFFLYEAVVDPHVVEKIVVKKEVQYKTRWKIKWRKNKELSIKQAKKCIFSPIIIDTKIEDNKMEIVAKDDCKKSRKDVDLEVQDDYTSEVIVGAVSILAGILLGVVAF